MSRSTPPNLANRTWRRNRSGGSGRPGGSGRAGGAEAAGGLMVRLLASVLVVLVAAALSADQAAAWTPTHLLVLDRTAGCLASNRSTSCRTPGEMHPGGPDGRSKTFVRFSMW